ncbi:MAG: hypothetical protein AAGN82_21515 [Myxococcota bacterium]
MTRAIDAPRHLELRHQDLGEVTAGALATAELASLEHLDLSYNPIADGDLARMLRNPTLQRLRYLSLLGTGANEETAAALAEGTFSELEVLELGDRTSDMAVSTLRHAVLPKLRRMQLRGASTAAIAPLQREGVFVTNAMFA